MKRMAKGELTVFFSLVFLLLLTLVGAVVESASIQVGKSERRADADRAMESVFAEYQKELYEEYGIFALEGTYETGQMSEENVLNRLVFYGAENMESEMVALRFLTDKEGQEFFQQAVEYEKSRTGLSVLEHLMGNKNEWEETEMLTKEYDGVDETVEESLENIFSENGVEESFEENPLDLLNLMKTDLFLELLLPEGFVVSEKELNLETVVSGRTRNQGYGILYERSEGATDAVLFNLYLQEKMGNACEVKDGTYMKYEQEYLLEGKASDRENLEHVAKKLCGIRFAANYAYLLTDQEKIVEAEMIAGSICSFLALPAVIPVVQQALLIAWAYGEGMMDVRTLLEGGEVALVKTRENWKLSLENVLQLKDAGLPETEIETNEGYGYSKYLQMFLLVEPKEQLTMRALDLMELNVSNLTGGSFLKMDQ